MPSSAAETLRRPDPNRFRSVVTLDRESAAYSTLALDAGAGDGDRTHDIKLGKLGSFSPHQCLSDKTVLSRPQLQQGVTAAAQNAGPAPEWAVP